MMILMSITHNSALLAINLFGLAMLFAAGRLLIGPTIADRVIALDLIAVLIVGFIAAYSVWTQQPILLRAAIVVALISFLGTVAFALLVEKRGRE